ncbi:MAG: hypothetical protein ACRYG5_06685 [Janthinobacterium lividum]
MDIQYLPGIMRGNAPLTAAELAEIHDLHDSPVVRKLLWEIHRLRATVLRANQVRIACGDTPPGIPHVLWDVFVGELEREPCITDPRTPRQQALLDRCKPKVDVDDDSTAAGRRKSGDGRH